MLISGRYELGREIARGASGRVCLARDIANDRKVALKLLDGIDPGEADRLSRNEFAILAGMRHPNLVEVLDVGRDATTKTHFLVMEYVQGAVLGEALAGCEESRALNCLVQAARALAFIHSKGLLHRDLKPANVLVRNDGTLKLVDFGLASGRGEMDGTAAGTLAYLPPETLSSGVIDARSDLYSLGLCFYHALIGRPPFEGKSNTEIIQAILEGRFPPSGAPPLAGPLGQAIQRLAALDPAMRFQSAGDLIRYIDLAAGEGTALRAASAEGGYISTASMVGRSRELGRLREILTALLSSGAAGSPSHVDERPTLVLLGGEAGIGKSRLLAEFRREAVTAGVRTIQVGCPEGAAAPLFPFSFVLRALAPPAGKRSAVSPGPHARLVRLLLDDGSVAAAGGGGLEGAPEQRVARERQILFDLFTRLLLQTAQTSPLVVLMEDLHWADRPTLDLLSHLALNARGSRLLLVGSHRPGSEAPEEFASWYERSATRGWCEAIVLDRFGEDEVAQMLKTLLEGAAADLPLVRALARESGGNPMFLLEILRSLQRENTLKRTSAGWTLPELDQVRASIPEDLSRALSSRLSLANSVGDRALGALAVIGRPAGPELVAEITGLGITQAADALEDLRSKNLVAVEDGSGRYDFEHALVRRAAEERLDPAERASLHLRVGRILERDAPGAPGTCARIALHLGLGGDGERASEYEERAGDQAFARRAPTEAARHYERSLELSPAREDEARAGILLKAGNGRLTAGDFDRARAHFEALLAIARTGGDSARQARALERLGTVLGFQKSGEEGVELVTEALALFRALGDHAGEARALHNLGIREARRSRYAEALPHFHAALGAHERLGEKAAMADERNSLGLVECFLGRYDEAAAHLQKAAELAIATDYRYLLAASRHNLGIVRRNQGRPEEALSSAREALALFDEIGHASGYCAALINVGLYARASGRFDEALDHFRRARAALAQSGEASREVYAIECEADLLRFLGQPLTAIDRLGEAIRVASRASDERQTGYATASLARALLDAARPSEAIDRARAALAVGEKTKTPRLIARSLVALAAGTLAGGEPREAAERARELLTRGTAEINLEDMAAEANLVLAGALIDLSDLPAAREALGAAREAIRARDVRALSPLADRIEARIARLSGDLSTASALEWKAEENRRLLGERISDETLRRSFLSAAAFEWPKQTSPAGQGGPSAASPLAALRTLYEISGLVGSHHDLDDMLNRVLDLALGIVGAARGLILLIDERSGALEIRTSRGLEPQTAQDAARYSRSVVKAAGEGQSILTTDAGSDERFSRYRSISMFRIKSLMCVPLKGRERVIGTVYVDGGAGGRVFTKGDLSFLEAFANQAAIALENARMYARLVEENKMLRREAQERYRFENFVGKSEAMQKVFDMMGRVADSPLPVLILGESGTGKELVAKALHFNSARRSRPFLSENCAAIPETLLESELFGYVQGAFTGADRDKKGLLEMADGGTLLLDEVGDMPMSMQAKLLRALQDGEFRPIGSKQIRRASVRIVAATNADLRRRIAEQRFREDLYYRLNVVAIELPPLRARREDVPPLVEHFLEKAAKERHEPALKIDDDLLALLIRYSWPGNVRQLENIIAKLVILARGTRIGMLDLENDPTLYEQLAEMPAEESSFQDLAAVEKKQMEKALRQTGGNREKAARLLGISRATIFRKIKEYGID